MSQVTTAIDAMSEQIGFDIGLSTDQSQANVINGMGKAFKTFAYSSHSQHAYVVKLLDSDGKKLITELAEMIDNYDPQT